jgi:uncharacterized protein (TIGR02996 family)
MGERDAFLAAIRAAPENDLPRLVFADWLDEHGEPERARFIRVGVELAKYTPPRKVVGVPRNERIVGSRGEERGGVTTLRTGKYERPEMDLVCSYHWSEGLVMGDLVRVERATSRLTGEDLGDWVVVGRAMNPDDPAGVVELTLRRTDWPPREGYDALLREQYAVLVRHLEETADRPQDCWAFRVAECAMWHEGVPRSTVTPAPGDQFPRVLLPGTRVFQTFRRGFVERAECPVDEWEGLRGVVRDNPVRRVEFALAQPAQMIRRRGNGDDWAPAWAWLKDSPAGHDPAELPAELFDALPGQPRLTDEGELPWMKLFPSEGSARTALSDTALRLVS